MITAKERLFKAIRKEETDRPPVICPGGMMNMIISDIMDIKGVKWPEAHLNAEEMAALAYGIYENNCFENVGVPFCMTVEAEAMGAEVYMGTKITEPRVTEYAINSSTEYKQLKNIDVNKGRAKVVLDAIKILKEKDGEVPIVANLTGPISLASSILDPVVFYKELRKKPEAVHEYMDFVTNNLINFGKAQLEAGADILTISDPSGTGEILGPKLFAEFALPYLNRIIDSLKEYAVGGTIIHICGRLKSVYGELNKLNSDVISFDSITSVREVVENVKNKSIMGNISTLTLEKGTEDTVKTLTNTCINNGVNILSPACGIGARSPIKNIQAIIEKSKEYGKSK